VRESGRGESSSSRRERETGEAGHHHPHHHLFPPTTDHSCKGGKWATQQGNEPYRTIPVRYRHCCPPLPSPTTYGPGLF
jgi:hypothetical protein